MTKVPSFIGRAMNWFLYDRDLRHDRINIQNQISKLRQN